MRFVFTLALCLAPVATAAFAGPTPVCAPDAAAEQACWVAAGQLAPTQLAYGAVEVARRTEKIAALDAAAQAAYLVQHPVTLVVGPGGRFYVTDGHHVALAYAAVAGKQAAVYATVKANWAALAPAAFWAQMQAAGLVYLYDGSGRGPQPLSALPADLFGLVDDPYRSLAWGVRKAGGYDDTTVPYADFLWANYFRSRVDAGALAADFDQTVTDATPLAHDAAASELPGYLAP